MKLLLIPIVLFSSVNLSADLSNKEIHSLKIAKKWIDKDVKSIKGKNGSVTFIFGATLPSILTTPLKITDIRLQEGEIIREMQLGDTVRWQVSPSISGTAPREISHVILKPTDVNLSTSLVIFTDRRTYNLNVQSTEKEFTPIVNFHYTDEVNKKWIAYQNHINQNEKKKRNSKKLHGTNQSIDNLDFKYTLSKSNYRWKPIRIYNDGRKTYIQMPKTMKHGESPILMVLSNGKQKLVNYRMLKDRFIVDKIFSQAVLIKGVGQNQEKIVISRGTSTSSNAFLDLLKNEETLSWGQ
ncbi:MAG: P-type conjugative transfer protein TrbG [Sulfurovum sp.]|nr:P-type conjugative transfer protein TrbG [Sulfurovum sp.]